MLTEFLVSSIIFIKILKNYVSKFYMIFVIFGKIKNKDYVIRITKT